MKILVGSILLIILLGGITMSCSSFGTRPNKEYKKSYIDSKHFNKEKGIFENRRPDLIAQMKKNNMNFAMIKEWFKGGPDRVPNQLLPEKKPDLVEFLKPSSELKVIWFGHSTFLLNMDGAIVLVDPVFGKSAAPFSFMVKRFQKPVLELSELPKIDYIIISHDHYDHLDMTSVKFFTDKETLFITPLGVGSHLIGWGIKKERITERDWWQSAKFEGVEFIATPAQHFSGRDAIHDNETLWASWVFKSKNHNIYFSGDSGYDTHFKDIGDKYGPFDIAFLENGQYNEKWKEVHMLPNESVQAYKDLKAKKYFPVHWGMFELALHAWYDPMDQLIKNSKDEEVNIIAPIIGEVVNLNKKHDLKYWWKL